MFKVFLAQTSIDELFQQMFSFENVNWNEVIKATNETLYMTFIPTFYVFVIGLLLGILLFLTGKGRSLQNKFVHFILGGIINVFRSIPFIILLTLLMPFTKAIMTTIIGPKGAIPTLVISAAPFYARLVDIALNEIPSGVIEAAESMGANTRQIITKVLIPESLPALVSGITVTAIALVGSTAVAGAIGAGGLGNLAYMIGFTRNKQDIIFVATVAILVLVFIIQIIGDLTVKAIDNRPLDRSDAKNVKRSAYVLGSGRQSCEPEFNFGIQAISAMASSTTQDMSHRAQKWLINLCSICLYLPQ